MKDLRELVLLAKKSGIDSKHGMAKWIEMHSIKWRQKGFKTILRAIEDLNE